jgi:hypothetical protein
MKLKLNEAKNLEFEMDANGVSEKDLKGYIRFAFEDIEYGFPVKFEEGKVSVSIPPFESFISRKVNESISQHKEVTVRGRLDIIANNLYMTPWSDSVEIEVPVSVKVEEAGRSSRSSKTSIKVLDPEIKEMMEDLDDKDNTPEKQQINEKKKSKMKEFFSNVKIDREEEDDLEEKNEEEEIAIAIAEEDEEDEFDKKVSKFKKLFEGEE